ncbi:MAG: secondary thiamine-phosphate synthase enzyme YjbQ [Candidatus Altiarchaeota archaeon]|nr:secondary thiamine-phosphate synthase enzyme YjbQ [Candidatus Altiarchaeota archaeon]
MAVVTKNISLEMRAETGIADITGEVQKAVLESELRNGVVTVFAVGSTGAVSTLEYEPGLLKDIPRALEVIAPSGIDYEHHKTWHDDNGKSHVRSTLIGSSLSVPFVDGELTLGAWQQIVVLNLDTSPRKRKVILQIMGE